jgi:8-oxo-dGTP diphosphatase
VKAHLPIVVGLVEVDSPEGPRFVVTRRRAGVHLAGSWELPGGKVAADETPRDALRRELHEELGVDVAHAEPITFSWYEYPERVVLLLFFHVRLTATSPSPAPLEAEALRLVDHAELLALPMPPANAPLLAALARPQETRR